MKNPSALAETFLRDGKVDDCPVIDCHAHYGLYQGIYFPKVTPEAMVDTLDRCGVRLIVASSHAALVDADRGNQEMADVIQRFPTRFRGYLGLNPNYPDQLQRQLDRYDELGGFVGLKFLSDYHRYPITGDHYLPALAFAEERGLPILMHTWGGSAYDSPQLVAELAERHPTVRLLMGHSGHGDWEGAINTAREHENVYLELCAAYAVRGVIDAFVNAVGSERVLFGTDLPWFDPHYGIGCVMMARISDDDRHNILHRNAERLFGEALP